LSPDETSAALIGFEPIETEANRKSTAELAQSSQQILRRRGALYLERASPSDVNLDIVPFSQPECLDDRLR
jgi:hypothetical protein